MKLLRVLTATGFVVLIAVAAGLVVRLESVQQGIVVQGQIDENGQVVPAGDAPDAETGINIKNGVQLAIERHNAANAGCQVQIKEFDTGGDPPRVSALAPQIVADAYTVGLIGPSFSGVAEATGALFEANGLPAATASASKSSLSEQGRHTFFRAVASDAAQGRAVAT